MSTDVTDLDPNPTTTGTTAPWPEPGGDTAVDLDPPTDPSEPAEHDRSSLPQDAATFERASWERPTLAVVLLATAVLYIWGLSASGWANSFYSAAAQAGSSSWKAFLFGSSDAANSITVDKPPASLWVMGLSVRMFGLSSWSILVPQALMGVATVGLVWSIVRRWFGAGAALLAAVVMALTPVAVLMFRFNNPDALLVLLMTAAAWTALRGIDDGRRRWVIATGVLLGFGFLTKQLQVLLVVPPLAVAHLVAAPGRLRRRIADVLTAGAAMIVSAGWWIALVELWPASSRPYIGGSQENSILELTLGYNGLGRLNGDETGSVTGGAGGPGGGMWGETGITRLFDGVLGGQIAWLLPAALVAIGIGLWCTRRAPRTDVRRAAVIVWGGWLLVTGLVFSFMAGIFHEYYTVALAPAVAILVGIGAHHLWANRAALGWRLLAAGLVAGTAWWSAHLLGRASDWNGWLAPTVLVVGVAVAVGIAVGWHLSGPIALTLGAVAAVACLAGPTAWSLSTAATAHTGSIVTAGPTVAGTGNRGGPGGPNPGGFPGAPADGGQATGGVPGAPGQVPGGGQAPGGVPGAPPNGDGRAPGGVPGAPPTGDGSTGTAPDGATTGAPVGRPPTGGAPGGVGGPGGLLDAAEPSAALVEVLMEDADDYTWVAAAVGSQTAAGYQLATEQPVMPIGGFNGSDPSPTLAEFQQDVADGLIHWFIAGGGFGPGNGGSSTSSSISSWVEANFVPVTVDGVTLYDLTPAA